jgi:hypothetical protein
MDDLTGDWLVIWPVTNWQLVLEQNHQILFRSRDFKLASELADQIPDSMVYLAETQEEIRESMLLALADLD